MQFLSVASNPALAPYPKFGYIITEIARTMGLDPEKVINSAEEAAVQAELLKKYQADQPQPEQPPAGANPADMTGAGDGNIGTGIAPGPEEQGFTGNEQQQQEQQPAAGGAPPGAGGPPPVA